MKINVLLMYQVFALLTFAMAETAVAAEGEEGAADPTTYYMLEPDIVTNFPKAKSKRLGFISVQVQLAVKESLVPIIEKHEPLIEDALVMHISSQDEEKIKSIEGRQALREESLKILQELFKEETGQEIIEDVLFTKYMWQ